MVLPKEITLCPEGYMNPRRFPGQEDVIGDSKIPTIIYYDSQGVARAAGAEATLPATLERAEEGQWVRAEWSVIYLISFAKVQIIVPLP
jgi:hypothetical protein